MTLKPHAPDAGLFSHINSLISTIEVYGHTELHVDWTNGMLYSDGTRNVFECLFEQLSSRRLGPEIPAWPHRRYTGRSAAALYQGRNRWRWNLNLHWNVLRVLPDITAEVSAFCSAFGDDATAVHIRNVHISSECPDGVAPTLEQYIKAASKADGQIFLATDNLEAVRCFRQKFGSRLLVRDIDRSPDMNTEHHLTTPQTAQNARDVLIDALIMARCGHLIHSVSNIATAVLYINPRMSHTFFSGGKWRRREGSTSPDERKALEATIASEEPVRLFHLRHPCWQDWIYVYENGHFVRHGCTDGGRFVQTEPDEFGLEWHDWDAETFRRANPAVRYDAHPHAMNAVNTLEFDYVSRSRKIVMRLIGGLGNQMFQYAFGFALAKELGAELVLEHADKRRPFALGIFGLKASKATRKAPDIQYRRGFDRSDFECLMQRIRAYRGSELRLEGYFQNEECFRFAESEIRERFSVPSEMPAASIGRHTVAVHVRLGDFRGLNHHGLCSKEYFKLAFEYMRSQFENPLFLIFSDEPERSMEFLPAGFDLYVLPPLFDSETQAIMQHCEAFIISNSTFSWWPAWISRSAHVICPDRFLMNQDWDICPTRWIKLPR